MSGQKKQIFISYRRDGGEAFARLLYDRLTADGYSVFYDIESLEPGKFNIALYERIMECTDFLLVLSPSCLDRCESPEDWFRREIEFARNCDKNLIPLMMRGFEFPANITDSLKDLPKYHGIEAPIEHIDSVVSNLEKRFLHSRPVLEHKKRIMSQMGQKRLESEADKASISLFVSDNSGVIAKSPGNTRRGTHRCPHCKCTSVKRSRSSLEMYIHPEEGIAKDQKLTVWVMKSEIIIQSIVPFLFMIPVFVGILVFASFMTFFVENNILQEIMTAVVSLFLVAAALLCIHAYIEIRDGFSELRKAIAVSKLRYWKLKCLGCEKKFGILLPEDDALKDWFPDLLDENEK